MNDWWWRVLIKLNSNFTYHQVYVKELWSLNLRFPQFSFKTLLPAFVARPQWRARIIADKYMGRWDRLWILNNILFSYVKCPITPIPRFLRHKGNLLYGTLYVFVLRFLLFYSHTTFRGLFLEWKKFFVPHLGQKHTLCTISLRMYIFVYYFWRQRDLLFGVSVFFILFNTVSVKFIWHKNNVKKIILNLFVSHL